MNFLYVGSPYHLSHAQAIKALRIDGHHIVIKNSNTSYLTEITNVIHLAATKHAMQIHGIIVSDVRILKKYVAKVYNATVKGTEEANLQNYGGTVFEHDCTTVTGKPYKLPVVIVPSPEHLVYSNKDRFIWERFISKLYKRDYFTAPKLQWELGSTPDELLEAYNKFTRFDECILIGVDIETVPATIPNKIAQAEVLNYREIQVPTKGLWFLGYGRTPNGDKSKQLEYQCPAITCSGYTGIFRRKDGSLYSYTVVIPLKSTTHLHWIRKFNSLPAPKVMHNGRYDATYFLRFNAPLFNYAYDTYLLMHSYLVELPRRLDFTAAFALRNSMYWKDEADGNLYEYNAKDCHATAWACLSLLAELPDWAVTNYTSKFKQVFPCICCGLEGFKEDPEEARVLWAKYKAQIADNLSWWDKVIVPNFNISSAPQVKQLFQTILATGVESTAKPVLTRIIHKHPLWRLFVEKLISSREAKKADSTYMNITLFAGRVLYELDPGGTLTARYASKSSSFWCGTQIQNIPEYARSKLIFDEGWEGTAIDNAQSESRTTAYVTGDIQLIDAVENAPDFHVRNASLFFGIPEEELASWKHATCVDQEGNEVPDTWLRNKFVKIRNKIGKKLNHGANYNMMEYVLITTMTPLVIIEAKQTLGLPGRYTFKQVATYLLNCFDKAYPRVRSKEAGGYHARLIDEIEETSMLVTPDNWTRFTFRKPGANKKDLNEVVAHKPQSWSVNIINRAFFDTWYQLQIQENKIRMKAQIHDEIMYQSRPEDSEYCAKVASDYMARPNEYHDVDTGELKTMVIPNDPITGGRSWSDLGH